MVGGTVTPVMHVSQVASIIGLESDARPTTTQLAYDTITVLTSWVDMMRPLDFELLVTPTPSRARSIRNLTVNTFHPFDLLPQAWRDHEFPWRTDLDVEREAPLTDAAAVVAYADEHLVRWQSFLLDVEEELDATDPLVSSPKGEVPFNVLMASQRNHCAHHHRQIAHFLREQGHDLGGVLDVTTMPGLALPSIVY